MLYHLEGNVAVTGDLMSEHLRALPWVTSFSGRTASTPAARQMRMQGIEPAVRVITGSFIAVPALITGADRVVRPRLCLGQLKGDVLRFGDLSVVWSSSRAG